MHPPEYKNLTCKKCKLVGFPDCFPCDICKGLGRRNFSVLFGVIPPFMKYGVVFCQHLLEQSLLLLEQVLT